MEQFITQIIRPPSHIIQAFSQQATATVYEAAGRRGAMDHTIRPIAPEMKLCGSALTVKCHPADNVTLHAAIALASSGDVIVTDVGECVEAGHWGEITTVAAQVRGVVGLVINGGVRDIEPIRQRGFPIFAQSISMKATTKETPGMINHPIVCGGVVVKPGDLVLGDDDGVVIVTREQAEDVLAAAVAREEQEAEVMQRLEAGELTLDILGFRQVLDQHKLQI